MSHVQEHVSVHDTFVQEFRNGKRRRERLGGVRGRSVFDAGGGGSIGELVRGVASLDESIAVNDEYR